MKLKLLLSMFALGLGLSAQVPTPQPQPSTATYSVKVLDLLPSYTRETYESTFGKQAPAFDPNRAPKSWFDSTAGAAPKTYNNVNTAQATPVWTTFTLSGPEAATVNLPGLPHFPKFVNPVTNSNVTFKCNLPNCAATQAPIGQQSTLAEAQAMLAEIGDPNLTITDVGVSKPGCVFCYSKNDPGSSVSIYYIGSMNVADYWPNRNVNGVGYPGKWTKSFTGVYQFVPDVLTDGSNSTFQPIPVPERTLLANEKFKTVILGLIPVSVLSRTDVVDTDPQTGGNGNSSGGGFTDADRLLLRDIHKALFGN